MDVHGVRRLVRLGQVAKHPRYHAGKRGLGFSQILTALERCYSVQRDDRSSADGQPLHPDGWFALSNLPNRRRLRIEFDVLEDEAGNLLLIVTAYEA